MRSRFLLPLAAIFGLFVLTGTANAQSEGAPSAGAAHKAHAAKPAKKPKTHIAKAKKATPKKKAAKPHAKPHAHPHPTKA